MITNKEEAISKISDLIKSISFANYARRQGLIERCRKLEEEVLAWNENDPQGFVRIKYNILQLETDVNQSVFWRKGGIFFGFIAIALVYIIQYLILNNISPVKYLSYLVVSIVGALLYFVTSNLQNKQDEPLFRIVIALIIPFICILFLFKEKNQVFDVYDKNVWSFMLGYSVDLLIMVMNKIIEKLKKLVE
ncbi:hypothetical protein [Paenibacillus sp. FSL L8-0638]|uniref:hypothetical protein n=1 Tax=Paenibacillus TaxID=44249 RepID=UPI00315939F2